MFVEHVCLRFEGVMQFFYKAPLFLQVGRLHARAGPSVVIPRVKKVSSVQAKCIIFHIAVCVK
jgi:hypothetical protein